ncbi:MAG: hypothetical protein WCL14_10190 [Bacteroidota bacterium]
MVKELHEISESIKQINQTDWKIIVIIIISGISSLGALIAAFAGILQSCRLRVSLGIETLLKYEEKFDSNEFKKLRSIAATSLLTRKPDDDIEDVLDFFETIGKLVSIKVLNKEMVWNTFYHWVVIYYQSSEEYINDKRKVKPVIYVEFVKLYKTLTAIERKEGIGNKEIIVLSEDELKKYLIDELIYQPEF